MRSRVMRILDVNLNRATEGLRVVEEICRFVLEDQRATVAVKTLRGQLNKVVPHSLLESRDAAGDVGREPYTRHEGQRSRIEDIFRANMKRAQEAVRCLEEFSKLISPRFGKKFKDIRFKLYDLEKHIALRLSKSVKLDFDLYMIIDSRPRSFAVLRQAISRGIKIVQLRDKDIDKKKYLAAARRMEKITRKAGVAFILNDHWDLVNRAGADGVHLGQEDLTKFSFSKVRRALGGDKIIGVSAYDLAQALKAERMGADYIGLGPIFKTPIKGDTKPVGVKLLKKVIRRVKIPVVAIGGINRFNIREIIKAGGRRVAAIRAFTRQPLKLWWNPIQ